MLRSEPQSSPRLGIQSLRSSLGSCTAELLGPAARSPARNASSLDVKVPVTAAPVKFDNILGSVEYALNAPALHQRCYELSVLLAECPMKDLPTVFHTIVDKIFGLSSGGRGWGLNSIQKSAELKIIIDITLISSPAGSRPN